VVGCAVVDVLDVDVVVVDVVVVVVIVDVVVVDESRAAFSATARKSWLSPEDAITATTATVTTIAMATVPNTSLVLTCATPGDLWCRALPAASSWDVQHGSWNLEEGTTTVRRCPALARHGGVAIAPRREPRP
jgi:hypothetical protein